MQRVTEKGQQLSGSGGRVAETPSRKSETLSLILELTVPLILIEESLVLDGFSSGKDEIFKPEFDFIEGRGRSR